MAGEKRGVRAGGRFRGMEVSKSLLIGRQALLYAMKQRARGDDVTMQAVEMNEAQNAE